MTTHISAGNGADSALSRAADTPTWRSGTPTSQPQGHIFQDRWDLKSATQEAVDLVRFSLPITSGLVIGAFNKVITTISVGHKSALWLAAASLGTMYGNLLGFSILFGFTSGLEPLCSQAFTGASDKRKAGEYLQQALVATSLLLGPIWWSWLSAEPVLLALGQEPEMARMAAHFLRWQMLDLIPAIVYYSMMRFLSAQGVTRPILYTELLSLPISVFFQWLLVFSDTPFNMGFVGASFALVLVDSFAAVILVCYMYWVDGHQCWKPWSFRIAFSMRGWKEYARMGFPATLMCISEWWAFEFVAIFAGWFGSLALAANSVILQTVTIFFSLFYGFGLAVAMKVGNAVGEKNPKKVRSISTTSVGVTAMCASLSGIVLFAFRHKWSYAFTSDEETAVLVASILPIVSVFHLFDALSAVASGIIRGVGRPYFSAALNCITFYVVAPISGGLCMVFVKKGVISLWLGLWASAVTSASICLWYIVARLDCDEVIREAQERLAGGDVPEDEESLLSRAVVQNDDD